MVLETSQKENLGLMDFVAINILMLLCLNIFTHSFCITCIQSERQALLKFKQDLIDTSNMLANWTSYGDCCNWVGVVCNNGHVTGLQLGRSQGVCESKGKAEARVRHKLGGKLNPSLLDLKHLSCLDLSYNTFEPTPIPAWFWNLTSNLHYLNISGNQFQGNIPDFSTTSHCSVVLDFSFNNFTGPLLTMSFNVTALDLSHNAMSGTISHFLCIRMVQLMKLEVLNLSNNLFSGEIPDCWENWPKLVAIEFCNNNFSGEIPSSMGALTSLQSLHLRNNNLVDVVPSSLRNCTELLTVDLGANHLSGEIPPWMGESLSKLIIISLQTNRFHGPIPEEFCALSRLQILDLSHNNLSGKIPSCIRNLSAMVSRNTSDGKISYKTSKGCFFDSMVLVMKGMVLNYSTTLKLIKLVDLSGNNLSGEIPEEVTSLIGLTSLNLSNNRLVGRIPDNIGDMVLLECVDLSTNNLSGEIPKSMAELSFLSYLNLSNNKLTGKIPMGTQLQSFDESSFLGTELSGPPLTNNSSPTMAPISRNGVAENVGNKQEVNWFYLTVEFGFWIGFFVVAAPMFYSQSWDLFISNVWAKLHMNFVASFLYITVRLKNEKEKLPVMFSPLKNVRKN
ncbi:LRR receptor-like serine/threonine-protein kinase FLS2 [Durio zibethinus]|uniref:LRR receptor-like serine/threonine-protein kinase FLS2 n=1 Tax=Durio zibethinus TaxID=66656 RepID=A0A6P6AHH0_DURZI|nr:LRR receptor-like serine/threonine-protein kinase FLS2 [Durio zibethinus]